MPGIHSLTGLEAKSPEPGCHGGHCTPSRGSGEDPSCLPQLVGAQVSPGCGHVLLSLPPSPRGLSLRVCLSSVSLLRNWSLDLGPGQVTRTDLISKSLV